MLFLSCSRSGLHRQETREYLIKSIRYRFMACGRHVTGSAGFYVHLQASRKKRLDVGSFSGGIYWFYIRHIWHPFNSPNSILHETPKTLLKSEKPSFFPKVTFSVAPFFSLCVNEM